jgi:hypothetical protein
MMAAIKRKSGDMISTRLPRKRVPIGDHLAAVIGVVAREMFPLEWIKGSNSATDHIVTEIFDYLDQQSVGMRGTFPFPFIAIFGSVGYEELDFPDDTRDAVSTEIKRLMERLEASSTGSEVRGPQPPVNYILALRGFSDRATAEFWIRGEWDLQEKLARLRAAVKALAESLPADYRNRKRGLMKASDDVRQEIAAALEAAINEEAKKHPQATYEEKKELAKWITAELRRFGLALSVEGTDKPCLIMANTGGRPGLGRFALYYTDEAGTRHDVLSPGALPNLKLTLDELTRAPYGGRTGRRR